MLSTSTFIQCFTKHTIVLFLSRRPRHSFFHHPSLLFTQIIFDTLPSSVSLVPSPAILIQAEMECVEAALKTSFRKEVAMKTSPQAFIEDLCVLNVQNGAPCEDFFVDDLFDFSNQDELVEEQVQEEEGEDKVMSCSVSVSPQTDSLKHGVSQPCSTLSAKDDFVSLPTGELSVPADELADLEWLSHFVEDSFSEHSAAYVAGNLTEKPKHHAIAENKGPELETVNVSTQNCFKSTVPAKARSKRARTGVRVWLLGSPSLNESSSSSASSSSSSSPPSPWLIYPSTTLQNHEPVSSSDVAKPPAKKPKKKTVPEWAGTCHGAGSSQAPRRCSHCGVQKTPQWRAGPLGAKTLCNACGVRYKSGRLFPEYRPACSPTFSSELHSNHHRKVLEMRRKKEVSSGLESGFITPVVTS